MAGCAGIKANGERCKGIAASGSDYCPAHDPARAGERKRAASKAARSKPNREIVDVKTELRAVIDGVLDGRVERGVGSCAAQLYHVLLRTVELERKIKEADELDGRLSALEAALAEAKGGVTRWG